VLAALPDSTTVGPDGRVSGHLAGGYCHCAVCQMAAAQAAGQQQLLQIEPLHPDALVSAGR
jgi:hypothetical protein